MIGAESCSSVIVDIEIIENCLKKSDGNIGKNKNFCSICKVEKFTDEDKNVYDPVVVSIGPYHHGKETLKEMEKHKWNWMNDIMGSNTKRNLGEYIKALKKVETIARSYYTEEIKMESKEFVNMLFLDGFFILCCLNLVELTYNYQDLGDLEEDPQNQINAILELCFIRYDLLLIENQIPFFVLKTLYELFADDENITPKLSDKVTRLVETILPRYPKSIKETNTPRDFDHLLHLCHIYLRPNQNVDFYSLQLYTENQAVNFWHNAIQYHIAGVQFHKREFHENNPHSLLDIRFINNVLEIPCFIIDENTLSLFKNLIALEKTDPKFENDITTYIIFMSKLINNPNDVTLLVSKGIIEHDLRSEEEVVDLFMRLSEGITFDYSSSFYLKNICRDLELYYRSHMKWWNVLFQRITSAIHDRI